MKTTLYVLILLTLSTALSAQIPKGSIGMGMDLSGTYSNTHHEVSNSRSDNYTKAFGINPNICFFLQKNFAFGISAGYNYRNGYQYQWASGNQSSVEAISRSITNSGSISPYIRYYWCLSKVFAIVPQLSATANLGSNISHSESTYNNTTHRTYNQDADNRVLSYGVNFAPAFVFWPHPQYGIEFAYASVGYNGSMTFTKSWKQTDKTDGFGFNFGPSTLRLGFKYYLFPKTAKGTTTNTEEKKY